MTTACLKCTDFMESPYPYEDCLVNIIECSIDKHDLNVKDSAVRYIYDLCCTELENNIMPNKLSIFTFIDDFLCNLDLQGLKHYIYEFERQEEHLQYCLHGDDSCQFQ